MNITAKDLNGNHIGQYISCRRTADIPRMLWKVVHEPLLVALVYIDGYGNKQQIGITRDCPITIQEEQ